MLNTTSILSKGETIQNGPPTKKQKQKKKNLFEEYQNLL